jgi:predicted aconitase with swiveling domain
MTEARTLVAGQASGPALVLEEPLSFWGGVDTETGDIVDVHHPQRGENVSGRVLVMPSGRGSSSSSSVLA